MAHRSSKFTALWCWLWRKTIHGKDDVLRLKNIYTEQIPIAHPNDEAGSLANSLVTRLAEISNLQFGTQKTILDWLRVEYAIEKPSNKLLAMAELNSDTWVSEVKRIRGKKRPLTAAGVQ